MFNLNSCVGNELIFFSHTKSFYVHMPLLVRFLESVDADHFNEKSTFHHILIGLIPNKKWRFIGVTIDQESLSRLTLRQLRIKASKLGIPLYSRKSKADLVKGVFLYEEKKQLEQQLIDNKAESQQRKLHIQVLLKPKSFFFLVIPNGHTYFGKYPTKIAQMLKMRVQ